MNFYQKSLLTTTPSFLIAILISSFGLTFTPFVLGGMVLSNTIIDLIVRLTDRQDGFKFEIGKHFYVSILISVITSLMILVPYIYAPLFMQLVPALNMILMQNNLIPSILVIIGLTIDTILRSYFNTKVHSLLKKTSYVEIKIPESNHRSTVNPLNSKIRVHPEDVHKVKSYMETNNNPEVEQNKEYNMAKTKLTGLIKALEKLEQEENAVDKTIHLEDVYGDDTQTISNSTTNPILTALKRNKLTIEEINGIIQLLEDNSVTYNSDVIAQLKDAIEKQIELVDTVTTEYQQKLDQAKLDITTLNENFIKLLKKAINPNEDIEDITLSQANQDIIDSFKKEIGSALQVERDSAISEKEKEIETLQSQIKKLEEANEETRAKTEQIAQLKNQIDSAQNDAKDLENTKAALQEAKNNLAVLTESKNAGDAEISAKGKEIQTLQAKMKELDSNLTSAKEERDSAISEKEKEIETLQSQIQKLEEEHASAQQELQALQEKSKNNHATSPTLQTTPVASLVNYAKEIGIFNNSKTSPASDITSSPYSHTTGTPGSEVSLELRGDNEIVVGSDYESDYESVGSENSRKL